MSSPNACLTAEGSGLLLNAPFLRTQPRWFEQVGRRHKAFGATPGLWVHEVEMFDGSGCAPVKLFMLVQADAHDRIVSVATTVYEVHGAGALEKFGLPFSTIDMMTARRVLLESLTEASRADLSTRLPPGATTRVSLVELQRVVGTSINHEPGTTFVDAFKLPKLMDPLGEDFTYTVEDRRAPIEFMTDHNNRVKTVFFGPRPCDVVAPDATMELTPDSVRARLGRPDMEKPGWVRFVSPSCVTVVEYGAAGVATLATMMTPESAP